MKTSVKFNHIDETAEWPHFSWRVLINDVAFEYKTGLGHRTDFRKARFGGFNNKSEKPGVRVESAQCWAHIPEIDQVLHCLFMDAQCGSESFDEFCANYGYSDDSLKALDTYRDCIESGKKLRLALGKDYQTEKERIEALEL